MKKLKRYIIAFVFVVIVVVNSVIPAFSRVSIDRTDGFETNKDAFIEVPYRPQIITNGADFSIMFLGNEPYTPLYPEYLYASNDVISGHIFYKGGHSSGNPYAHIAYNDVTDRYSSNTSTTVDGVLITDSEVIAFPQSSYFESYNTPQSNYLKSVDTYYDDNVVGYRYSEVIRVPSSFGPNGVVLHADSLFVDLNLFPSDGYSGFRLLWANQEGYSPQGTYEISAVAVAPSGVRYNLDYSMTINRQSGSYYYNVPLVPYTVYDLLRSNVGRIFELQDITVKATFSDEYATGLELSDGFFRAMVIYDVIAGDYGRYNLYDSGRIPASEVFFDNFDVIKEEFQYIAQNGDSYELGYDNGFRDGYADGEDDGYNQGLDEAYSKLNVTGFIGQAAKGFLDFQLWDNVTLGGLLSVCLGMSLVMMFLKFFA